MNRREFLSMYGKLGICGAVLSPFDCEEKEEKKSEEPIITNKAPTTDPIDLNFKDGGKVEYSFSGSDSDGSISRIYVTVNGSSFDLDNNSSKLVDIISGTNNVSAKAYDDEDEGGNVESSSFVSPVEIEAKNFIENYLMDKDSEYASFEKEMSFFLGETGNFDVDFWIKTKTKKDAVINYIGYKKNLEQEIFNKSELDKFGIPNLYLVRIPTSEIEKKMDSFLGGLI